MFEPKRKAPVFEKAPVLTGFLKTDAIILQGLPDINPRLPAWAEKRFAICFSTPCLPAFQPPRIPGNPGD